MIRRSVLSFMLIVAALLALTAPALAGGWAVITVDTLPGEVHAGETLHLGFTVRQHGRTPIDNSPFDNTPLKPFLSATKKANSAASVSSGQPGANVVLVGTSQKEESIRVDARKEGPLGHFVVDVTFPSDGTWEWELTAPPFEGTKMEPMTVLPGLARPEQSSSPSVEPSTQLIGVQGLDPAAMRWTGVVLLLVAVGLALARRRDAFGRWATPRSR